MWEKLKQKVWQWRGVLVTVPSVTAVVIGIRSLGLLQPLEFPLLDQFFLLRSREPIDSRIVIVEYNEADIKTWKWPIPDGTLAKLIETIKRQQPAAIGLDFYRDLPVNPGQAALARVFATTPNLIGVQKTAASADSSAVDPPPLLKKQDQVGANDFILDADNKIRRVPISLLDKKTGENIFSFGFRLAAIYLESKQVPLGLTPDELVYAGPVVFPAFDKNDGGYVRADDRGYQIILNYRGEAHRFNIVTMTQVLENQVPADLMRDRIVLIGPTAESLKDLFPVPYSSSLTTPTRMAGVVIHANFISQILSAALDGRQPTLRTLSEPQEWLWVLCWSAIGALLTWVQRYSDRPPDPDIE
ncbi:CHASE2 domain-containing protein [Kovacikia minuta CCNUW1]|uniref:CHASE2 domain-containing protein n=1 Tax=Kovacikia minuta TaxID=2931930 RepID=UPI001CCF735E|nr:CHASE2 domain-containing protein [Kovacikia minuta]UBF23760.1 CHASE2 domain-containing protein [Kovacikia minuta CCNUW1]